MGIQEMTINGDKILEERRITLGTISLIQTARDSQARMTDINLKSPRKTNRVRVRRAEQMKC
jgi:hypothetical protein